MKRRIMSTLAVLLCFCFCLYSTPVFATSQEEVDKLKDQYNEATSNKKDLQNQKKDAENDKKNLESEASGLSSKISSLNNQISSVTSEIGDTEANIETVQGEIDLLTESIKVTTDYLDVQKEAMKKRIQFMYENKSTSSLVSLLESGSVTELITRIEYIAQIAIYDKEAIAKYEETQAELEKQYLQVQEKMDELVAYQNELENKKTQLGSLVSSTKTALNEKNTQIANSEAAIAELEKQLAAAIEYEKTIQQAYFDAQVSSGIITGDATAPYQGGYGASEDETLLLAALIQAEADNQGDLGRVSVGSVVMNRVASNRFPNSITEVIYSPKQFAPVASGRVATILAIGPNERCKAAARRAVAGPSNINSLFFCTKSLADVYDANSIANGQESFYTRTSGVVINAHYFYVYVK